MIKAILFDLDGVLVDAVDLHYEAFRKAIRLFGFDVPPSLHQAEYNGLPTDNKLRLLSQKMNLPPGMHAYLNELKQQFTFELLETRVKVDPQIKSTLLALRDRGYRLGLASNCISSTVRRVIEKMEIASLFDVILSREEVSAAKPSPAIYIESLRRLELTPEEVLIVEDSAPGVQAALSASPNVLVVTHPRDVTSEHVLEYVERCETQCHRQNSPIEIVIPMAGAGSRFAAAGYTLPKPLIDVKGKPMIQWVVENLTPANLPARFNFIVDAEHLERYQLERLLNRISPGCKLTPVRQRTEGAACSVLLATSQLPPHRALMVANSDQWVETDIEAFVRTAHRDGAKGLIMSFPADEAKWSYAKTDPLGFVSEVAEKKVISPDATVGIYYFDTIRDFNQAARQMISRNIRTNGEFYLCPVYNQLLARGAYPVKLYPISRDQMHGLGTPEDLEAFLGLLSGSGLKKSEGVPLLKNPRVDSLL